MTIRSLLFNCLMTTIYILGANKEEDGNFVLCVFRWLEWKVDNIIRIDTIFFFFFSLLLFLSEAFYTTSRCEKVWDFLGASRLEFPTRGKKREDCKRAGVR